MRVRSVALLILVDVSTAFAFAFAWGLKWQACAPPNPLCKLTVCATVCVEAWSQFPENLFFGVSFGVVPLIVAAVGLRYLETRSPGPWHRVDVALITAAVVVAAGLMILLYL